MKYLIEGLDRTGKNLLIDGILNKKGYHQVIHYSKPLRLECYSEYSKKVAERIYQEDSFRTMFKLLSTPDINLIMNRSHIGECVYSQLYRGYSGDYVMDLEKEVDAYSYNDVVLILLTEDFSISKHFVDDNLSLGKENVRPAEQELFLNAFNKSVIFNKRIICVTARDGSFKSSAEILEEALA